MAWQRSTYKKDKRSVISNTLENGISTFRAIVVCKRFREWILRLLHELHFYRPLGCCMLSSGTASGSFPMFFFHKCESAPPLSTRWDTAETRRVTPAIGSLKMSLISTSLLGTNSPKSGSESYECCAPTDRKVPEE